MSAGIAALAIAAVAALLALPAPASSLALLVLGTAVLALRRSRSTAVLAAAMALAAALGAVQWASQRSVGTAGWRDEVGERFGELLAELEADAGRVASALGGEASEGSQLGLFEHLEDEARRTGRSYLLLDENAEAVAWGGPGLLHDPSSRASGSGVGFVSGFTAATLFWHRDVAGTPAGWRLIAGVSLPVDRLPVSPGPGLDAAAFHWQPAWEETGGPWDWWIAAGGLHFGVRGGAAAGRGEGLEGWAAIVLGAALLGLALGRCRQLLLGDPLDDLAGPVLGAAGLVALAVGTGADPLQAMLLAVSAAVVILAARFGSLAPAGLAPLLRATIGVGLPLALALAVQRAAGSVELSGALFYGGGQSALRLAMGGLVVAAMLLPSAVSVRAGSRALAAGVVLTVIAAGSTAAAAR
ncbi:MAG: hypothetical protein R3190_04350, partial [Thermoanaerobaculia bacterium]|nr:hypothetical protein [Thermoanaerobaculia bacterium]